MTSVPGRRVPVLVILTFFLTFAGPGAVQGYLKNIAPAQWSPVEVTSILVILYFSFMIWRILIPASQRLLGDKWSMVLAPGAYLLVPVGILLGLNYWLIIAFAAVWGWGAAGLWQTGPVWLYDATNRKRRGLWAGVLYVAVFLGLAIGAKAQGLAAERSGRQAILALATLPGAAAMLAALALPRRKAIAAALSVASVKMIVLSKRLVLLGILLLASATAYGLILSAFRDNIEHMFGPAALGTMLACYFGIRLVVSIAGGHLSDVFARRAVIATAFLAGSAALLAAGACEARWTFVVAACCLGLVSGVVPVSATACAGEWFPPEKRSLALGAAFVWRDAGMVSSLIAGRLLASARGDFASPIFVFAAVFAVCGIVSFALPGGRSTAEEA